MKLIDPHKLPTPGLTEMLEKNKHRFDTLNKMVLMMKKLEIDIVDNDFIAEPEKHRMRHRYVSHLAYKPID